MKKGVFSVFATLCMIFSLSLSFSAQAVDRTTFSDVDANAGYAEAIYWAAEHGYIYGYTDGRFGVNDLVSRSQLAAIFYRAAGNPAISDIAHFSDVQPDAYYANAINWAEGNGLINGFSDGRFGVEDPVTRQQVVTILWRWAGSPPASGADYIDGNSISAYAQTAVDWSYTNSIMAGREGKRFSPEYNATRTEVVSALYQYMNLPSSDAPEGQKSEATETREESSMPKLQIQVGGQTFTATLEDNPTTQALLYHLPMTVTMGELNGNEKYYYMSTPLPTDTYRPGNIHVGDFMLFGSDCLVLFYKEFSSSYSYTRLGNIEDAENFAQAVGGSNVSVSFVLAT